ncbi:MAG: YqgE/AlgH family protein [Odoribacteraceae bacterium]|jgi:putative transcriptional regulator|nr:YqgE/AlgH family protein [Odoribacteraceae bacterium]
MEEQFQDLYRVQHDGNRVSAGKVLVADPFLEGPYFGRSVVYMVEHGARGSVGFVLNKPLSYPASDLRRSLRGLSLRVYAGGPVDVDHLHYLHRLQWIEGCRPLPGGVYWGGNFDMLASAIGSGQMPVSDVRFFAGYSGWDGGQLDAELKERSWSVGEIDARRLFSLSGEELWHDSRSALGKRYRIRAVFPENPMMN